MTTQTLRRLKELKACSDGDRVTFRARVLRFWEVGGRRMTLVGDETALVRCEIGPHDMKPNGSYEFHNLLVRQYPGGWHSASVDERSHVGLLEEDVAVSQDEAYIERTYKILAGIQRKKGRKEGRLPAWRHASDVTDMEGHA